MRINLLWRDLFTAALIALFSFPLLWMLSYALRPTDLPPPTRWQLFAPPFAFDNFARVGNFISLNQFIFNSMIISAIAVPLTLLTASLAGLAMTQFSPRVQRALVGITIGLMLVPAPAVWVPRFILFAEIGWIDTFAALIAPAVMGTNPFYVLIFYLAFSSVSREVYESARLDGANLFQTWHAIALPLARPALIAVALLSFTFYWSDYANALLYLRSEVNYTLPVGVQFFKQIQPSNYPLLMAASVILVAPVLALFLIAQKFFLQGQVELAKWLR